jgi:hypothetical protein
VVFNVASVPLPAAGATVTNEGVCPLGYVTVQEKVSPMKIGAVAVLPGLAFEQVIPVGIGAAVPVNGDTAAVPAQASNW